jgi:hypothetical protein
VVPDCTPVEAAGVPRVEDVVTLVLAAVADARTCRKSANTSAIALLAGRGNQVQLERRSWIRVFGIGE